MTELWLSMADWWLTSWWTPLLVSCRPACSLYKAVFVGSLCCTTLCFT